MNINRGVAGAWLLAAVLSTTAQAQGVIVGLDGSGGSAPQVVVYDSLNPPHQAARFTTFEAGTGSASVAFGDVNGDGVADRIVGAGPGAAPRVRVFSGADNALLADFLAFDAGFTGGVRVAAGQVNTDGRADLVVASGPGINGRVRVFSGADTSQVLLDFIPFGQQNYQGGLSIAAGDFNGDSRADILVAPGPQFTPMVGFFNGSTGEQFDARFPFGQQQAPGGLNIAVGDVNGDGVSDLVVGSGGQSAPRVVVLNLVTQETLFDFLAFDAGFTGGVQLSVADLDGDGHADIVVGAGPGGGSAVRVFSGADPTQRLADFTAFGGSGSYSGGVFVGATLLPVTLASGGQLRFSAANYSAPENSGNATISIERINGSNGAASVQYRAQAGTANSQDFVAVSGSLTWADGDVAAKTFQVPIRNDSIHETDETVLLSLENPAGAELGEPASATLTLVDDDAASPPTLIVDNLRISEGPAGRSATADAVFVLSAPSSGASSIDYATRAGSAVATAPDACGADFEASSGTVRFEPGETRKTVRLTVFGDGCFENSEFFLLAYSNPVNLQMSGQTSLVDILDDDEVPTLSIGAASVAEGFTGTRTTLRFPLQLSARTGSQIRVGGSYKTEDRSATAGEDYVAVTDGHFSIQSGETTTGEILITVIGDSQFEPDETLALEFGNGSRLRYRNTEAIGTILNDDAAPPPDQIVSFVVTETPVLEGDEAILEVHRVGSLEGPVSVDWATVDDSAVQAIDYVRSSGRLSWDGNDSNPVRQIRVRTVDDTQFAPPRRFKVRLSNPIGTRIDGSTTANVNITDNDSGGSSSSVLQFEDRPGIVNGQIQTPEFSPNPSIFPAFVGVTREGPSTGATFIDYVVEAVSASDLPAGTTAAAAALDFRALRGSLVWQAGDRSIKFLELPTLDDGLTEGEEVYRVRLLEAGNGSSTGGRRVLIVRIADDDPAGSAGTVSFVNNSGNSANRFARYPTREGGTVSLRLQRRGGGTGAVSLPYLVCDGRGADASGPIDTGSAACGSAPAGPIGFADPAVDAAVPTFTGAEGPFRGTVDWADGEAGEKTVDVTTHLDQFRDLTGQLYMVARLGPPTGGATIGEISVAQILMTENSSVATSVSVNARGGAWGLPLSLAGLLAAVLRRRRSQPRQS